VDSGGLSPTDRRPPTKTRLASAGITVVAVVLIVVGSSATVEPHLFGLLLIPVLAGLGISVQQALNGRTAAVSSPMAATTANYAAGSVALLLVASQYWLQYRPIELPTQGWSYAGGLFGVLFILGLTVAVRALGVFALGMGTVLGQACTSIIIDLCLGRAVAPLTLLGTTCLVSAIALTLNPWSKGRRGTRSDLN
jgi:transporter family-2 protein